MAKADLRTTIIVTTEKLVRYTPGVASIRTKLANPRR
jgi:hypothetical protein